MEHCAASRGCLQKALDAGYDILTKGQSALDAVENAVRELENTPLFNAGKGSVFTSEGTHEMDASIMEGNGLVIFQPITMNVPTGPCPNTQPKRLYNNDVDCSHGLIRAVVNPVLQEKL